MIKNIEKKVERSGLHDSGIDSIEYNNKHLRMEFSDVNVEIHGNIFYKVVINMIVVQIKRNNELVNSICLEAPGSSVLDFERSGDIAKFSLYWINYDPQCEEFCEYEIKFDAFDLQVFPQEEEP